MSYIRNGHTLRDTATASVSTTSGGDTGTAVKNIAKTTANLTAAIGAGYYAGTAVKNKTKSTLGGIAAGVGVGLGTSYVTNMLLSKI